MDDFSLSDAIDDDASGQTSKMGKSQMPGSTNRQTENLGWPKAAPGAPHFVTPGAPQPSAPSFPGAAGQYPSVPTSSGHYHPGSGVPGQYPGTPSMAAGYPGSQNSHGPGAPAQLPFYHNPYPAGGNAPGQFPGGSAQPYLPGIAGSFPSGPGVAPGHFPSPPYPSGQSAGAYVPGRPGSFPAVTESSAFPHFPGSGYPPMPAGTWGMPGPFPTQPGYSGYNPDPMGRYPNPSFGGQPAPGGMPEVPFHLPLHAGLMPGVMITIVGEPMLNAKRFHVDFVKEADVAFHFNPRFNERIIVRNTNVGGEWGPEEREGLFPFDEGRRFELKILVEEDMFKVAVDGSHLLEYEHRVGGLEEVTLLRIEGDVILHSVAPCMI
ncbi:galectin-3 [Paramormyrops kingsleyae]|uniref:Galectin n=1 Tax=Paramormyrops kingsleyae TaxID=1676925 RepID=A0A3B3RBU2_9TELE|nr:galectin-3-like [Paramormyrops kingsleyae]